MAERGWGRIVNLAATAGAVYVEINYQLVIEDS